MGFYRDTEKTIAIVGGGSTSLGVTDGIIEAAEILRPSARVTWLTSGNAFGCGLPWETSQAGKRGEPISNQPGYAMSPFARDPEDYIKTTGTHRHKFDTRHAVGEYFASTANRLLRAVHALPGIKIDPAKGDVRAITCEHGKFHLHITGHGSIVSDRVVLATGHTSSRALNHLRGHPGYVESPTDCEDLSGIAARSRPDTVVTFNGSGGSTLDAVKYLEENGYGGSYNIVSHGLNYWPFEPEKYDPLNSGRVAGLTLSHATIKSAVSSLAAGADVHETLMEICQQKSRRWVNVGFKHVLDAFPFAEAAASLRDDYSNETAARSVENYHDHLTSPQSYAMVQRLLHEKRLDFHKGSITQIVEDVEGFTIRLEDGGEVRARTLINATPFVKGVGTKKNGHSPLFTQLIQDGLVRIDDSGIVKVGQNGEALPGLYIVGPASHSGKAPGIESFRGLAHDAGPQRSPACSKRRFRFRRNRRGRCRAFTPKRQEAPPMSTNKSRVEEFQTERTNYNQILAQYANSNMKRFYGIDATSYGDDGALPKKTKELLGFVASLVLRCDDCILYHLIEAHKAGVTSEELSESINIAQLVGGSITIPHIRRAVKVWHEELGGADKAVQAA